MIRRVFQCQNQTCKTIVIAYLPRTPDWCPSCHESPPLVMLGGSTKEFSLIVEREIRI